MKLLKILDQSIAYGFYILFFATPLIFNPSRTLPSSELFEWNKMAFVYVLTTVIVAAWLIKIFLTRKTGLRATPFTWPILLFFFSQVLATLFSIDRHVSIFGYYSRFHGGLLSITCYVLLYFAFVANSEIVHLKRLFLFVVTSGVLVAIYGVLERFGIDAQVWVQDVRSRVFSTLGQPNWLAAFIVILLPITIFRLLQSNPSSPPLKLRGGRVGLLDNWKVGIYWIIGLLFYTCLLFTKSRSGFLGFWAANLLLWISLFYINSSRLNKIFPLFLILNSLFFLLNFFFRTPFPQYDKYLTLDIFYKQLPRVETKPPIGDSVINVGITDSADIRRIVWQGAIDITKANPLFGTGPETFAFAYYKFRPEAHNLTSEWDFLYNRAHNEFLNISATSGLVGLGTYLILILCVIDTVSKLLSQEITLNQKLLVIALLCAYLSILITNFFGFSVVIVGLYFFLIPGFLVKIAAPQTSIIYPKVDMNRTWFAVPIIILAGITLFTLYRFWVSDSLYALAQSANRQEKVAEAYQYITRATQIRDGEPVYHDERASITNSISTAFFNQQDATNAAKYARESLEESKIALKISPRNVNFWKTRTRMLFLLSNYEPSFTSEALRSILIAYELAPTDPKITYNVAVIYGRLGKNQDAIAYLKKTIDLKPDYRDAYVSLSIFYQEDKQVDLAQEILQLALKRINPDDQEIKERLEKLNK